ncbi:type IV secretory system conjugative DNA transfer family protein [Endozoicomonas acroporae]|uniref:type IV secretory system conjugative DNA transfer family protein n=1 Tax=Endozoicomonas acroporae TaxID=1701104 RepID=UPI000C75F24E|nr:type IV secretion system DNA-binding domain-containing protein [Endozoicomonas acroporae]
MKKIIDKIKNNKLVNYLRNNGDIFESLSMSFNDRRFNIAKNHLNEIYPDAPKNILWDDRQATQKVEGVEKNSDEHIVHRFKNAHLGMKASDNLVKRNRWALPLFIITTLLAGYFYSKGINAAKVFLVDYNTLVDYLSYSLLGVFTLWMIMVSTGYLKPVFSWFYMPKALLKKQQISDVYTLIKRTLVRDVDDAPDDLKDQFRNMVIDENGDSVDGQLLASDIKEPVLFQKLNNYFAIYPFLAIYGLIAGMSLNSAGGSFQEFIGSGNIIITSFFSIPVLVLMIINIFDGGIMKKRQLLAEASAENSITTVMIDTVGKSHLKTIEETKQTQIENCKKDDSAFIKIGTSTGLFADRRDNYAPSESGIDFGLTVNDLSVHCLITGGTGSGKTSCAIRPILRQLRENTDYGLLVLDGKSALPIEIETGSDYQLISPKSDAFNAIEGLSSDEVADGFFYMFKGNGGDSFWDEAARTLVRASHCCLDLVDEVPTTMSNLYKALTNNQFLHDKLLGNINRLYKEGKLDSYDLAQIEYRVNEYPSMPDKSRDSVLSTARNWLSTIIHNKKLAAWADTEHGVKVEDVTTGSRIGICLPQSEYGYAGTVISNFAKNRVYKAIQQRGDVWEEGQKPVMVIIDECQELISDNAEGTILPVARSLGMIGVYSTQNLMGLYKKMGSEHAAKQMLGNLKNLIAFDPKDEVSRKFIQERMGNEWRITTTASQGSGDTKSSVNGIVNNASTIFANNNKELVDNAGRSILGNTTRQFWGSSMGALKNVFKQDNKQQSSKSVEVKLMPLVQAEEVESLLAKPNTALASIVRGRVVRRDVITLKPEFNNNN